MHPLSLALVLIAVPSFALAQDLAPLSDLRAQPKKS